MPPPNRKVGKYMGCWNETCLMSNMPIRRGDKVVLLVLRPQLHRYAEEGNQSRPDAFFIPVGFPIVGTYDDYGSIDVSEEEAEKVNGFFADMFAPSLFYKSDYRYVDRRTDKSDEIPEYEYSTVNQMCKDLERGKIYFTQMGKMGQMTIAMVHDELYQALMNNVANRFVDVIGGKGGKYAEVVDRNLRDACERMCKSDEDFAAYIEESNSEVQPVKKRRAPRLYTSLDEIMCIDRNAGMNDMSQYYIKTRDENVIVALRDMILWRSVMDLSRKGYSCTSGKGGQAREMRLHLIIYEFVKEKCRQLADESEEYYEDECDEDIEPDEFCGNYGEKDRDVLAEEILFWENRAPMN